MATFSFFVRVYCVYTLGKKTSFILFVCSRRREINKTPLEGVVISGYEEKSRGGGIWVFWFPPRHFVFGAHFGIFVVVFVFVFLAVVENVEQVGMEQRVEERTRIDSG